MSSTGDATCIKQPCRVTVTAPGWHGAKAAAIAAGCTSISDMIEKLGSGELAIITPDAIRLDPLGTASTQSFSPATDPTLPNVIPQHVHYHAASSAHPEIDSHIEEEARSLPKLVITGLCATIIVGSLLYIADRFITITAQIFSSPEKIEDIITPVTGDIVAGYTVSDEYGIRPFHPVTGAPNVPHNGVDLAMDIGTPIYAVGKAGDRVDVECWWDIDGGGQVVDQTAESYPGYTFQSLHMSENGCKEGNATAGDIIAYSGNTGLGTGAHYDFRVKIDNEYVPPATKYLESAVTGDPPKE
ncbi:MAG: M23 family metallopeptidase [Phormidesmis sp.]